MKECRYCGSTYADSLAACPNCGGSKIVTAEEKIAEEKLYVKEVQNQERAVSVPAETEKKRVPGFVITLGVAVAVIAIIIAISVGGGNNLGNQTSQINAAFEAGQKYYNTGNYEAAIGELSNVSIDSKHYEDAQTMLSDAVEKYRTATLDRVSTYTNNGEYETALSLLVEAQSVLPDDTALKATYDSAYTAYVDSVIAKADSYSQAADYETAVGILNTAKNKYPQDTRLEANYVSTYAAYKTLVCQNAISEADAYAANGDYVNAIQTLNTAVNKVGQDEAVSAKIKAYTESYKQDLFVAAQNAYHNEGYEAAVSVLRNGKTILGEDAALAKLIEDYAACAPIPIKDLDCIYWPLTQDGPSWQFNDSWLGKDYVTYTNITVPQFWRSYSSYDWDSWTIAYDLDKNYELLSGTMLYDYGYASAIYPSSGWIKIYGDGNLLYSCTVTYSEVKPFSVNIENVKYLEITISRAEGRFGNGQEAQMVGISEFNIFKNVMP